MTTTEKTTTLSESSADSLRREQKDIVVDSLPKVPSDFRTGSRNEKDMHDEGMPRWLYFLMVLTLLAAFWPSDHEFNRSVYFRNIASSAFDGTHNRTADRLGKVDGLVGITRVLFALVGFYLLLSQSRFRLRLSAPLLWLSFALAGMMFASVVWSINPLHTLFKLVVLGCLIVPAIGFAVRFPLRLLLEWFAIVCAIYICIGVFAELFLGTLRPGGEYRFIGTTHPNTEAIYGAIICLCARLFYQPDRSKLVAVLLFCIGFICILVTKSRTTLAATIVALAVVQTVSLKGLDRLLVIVAGLFAVGSFAIAAVFLSSQGFDQLENLAAMGRTDDVSSLTGRLPLWEELIISIRKSPVVGYGYLAYWDSDRVESLSRTLGWEIPHGHNLYLDVALDIGVFGALLFIGWLLSALLTSANQCSRTGKVEYAIVAGIVTCALINGGGESLFKIPSLPLFMLLTSMWAILDTVEAAAVVPNEPLRRIRPLGSLQSRPHASSLQT